MDYVVVDLMGLIEEKIYAGDSTALEMCVNAIGAKRLFDALDPDTLFNLIDVEKFAMVHYMKNLGYRISRKPIKLQRHLLFTALNIDSPSQRREVFRTLIHMGADIHETLYERFNVCHLLLKYHKDYELEDLHMLLYYNVNVNDHGHHGRNAFTTAITLQLNAHAEILIDYIEDINEKDEYGCPALYYALRYNLPIVSEIIKRGGDVNALCCNSETPEGYKLNVPCLYASFISASSTLFEVIWPKVDKPTLLNCEASLLSMFIDVDWRESCDFLRVLSLIFESEYINDFVEHYYRFVKERNGIFMFYTMVYSFGVKRLPAEERLKYLQMLLSRGVPIGCLDIDYIYRRHGFSDDLQAIFESQTYINECESTSCGAHLMVHRFVHNSGSCEKYYRLKRYIMGPDNYLDYYLPIDSPEIPSLVQICRDQCREVLYRNSRRTAGFTVYSAVKKMCLPKPIENILLLRQPIYKSDRNLQDLINT